MNNNLKTMYDTYKTRYPFDAYLVNHFNKFHSYGLLDDDMSDACDAWISDLDQDELIHLANKFAIECDLLMEKEIYYAPPSPLSSPLDEF